ncbi:MAG: hypothetical protein LUI39_08405 [Lachnospiraceae bacterium]|nr:hypothetical protein [Lachnospiraceae bacterium]
MKNKLKIGFIALCVFLCAVPLLGFAVGGSRETSSENRELAAFPSLTTEDGLNVNFLDELGDWYEDHFAFRSELVTAYGLITGKVFATSAQEDSVIVGTNGWLYYKDALPDYQGTNLLTERQLFDAAHTLAMIQTYVEENGASFAFTIAPNKMTLYPESLPYYYSGYRSEESNLQNLIPWLESEGVNYVDLYTVLSEQDEVLYHARDSHWNNKGAALASDTILTALGQEHVSYEDAEYEVRTDFIGDLDEMLYPSAETPEDEIYYDPEPEFTYLTEVESNYDAKIYTESDSEGSLVMYRDSFCNALLPFMAESYGNAYFSRGIPYQLATDMATNSATTVIVEKAERFIDELCQNAPVMPGLLILDGSADDLEYTEEITDLTEENDGTAYTKISGTLEEGSYETDSQIYIRLNDYIVYEAFPVSPGDGKEGFVLYVPSSLLYEDGNRYELGIS